jgi:carbamoylphosphate synthase large subunit
LTPLVHLNAGFSLAPPLRMLSEGAAGRFRVSTSSASAASSGGLGVLPEPKSDHKKHPDAFAEEMLDVCKAGGVSLLFPQHGAEAIAANVDRFHAAGVDVLLAGDAETLRTLDDKWDFTMAVAAAGLPVAVTRHASDEASFMEHVAEIVDMGLVACVKPPIGIYGAGYWRLDDDISLFSQMMDPDKRRISTSVMLQATRTMGPEDRLLVCEYLPGSETSIDVACADGETLVAVGRKKSGRVRTLIVDGPAIELARATVALFGLSGVVNVQTRNRADGSPALLEINARMSGGCMTTAFAGVNIPLVAVGTRLGVLDPSKQPKPASGIQVRSVDDATTLGDSPVAFSQLDLAR